MKVELWAIGKTNEKYLEEGLAVYLKRLPHYLPFQMDILPDPKGGKNWKPGQFRLKEGVMVLDKLKEGDYLILLDERGKQFSSVQFARYLDQLLMSSSKRIVFLIGGAYGFSEDLYQRANARLALSTMTFSHQMVRLFFLEQLYRGMTILRGEKYHNP